MLKIMSEQTPKKISFGLIESHCIAVWHAPVTITVSDYPELVGMTENEMKKYIEDNFWDMNPIEEDGEESYSDSLYDDLTNMSETRQNIYDEKKEIFFAEVEDSQEQIIDEEENTGNSTNISGIVEQNKT